MLKVVGVFFLLFAWNLCAQESIKIGILAKRSNDITMNKWSETAEYLTQRVEGYSFEIVPLLFWELQKSVAAKEIDFVLTNTMYYVALEHDYGVSRIATLKNISSSGLEMRSYGSVILTKSDSDIYTLDDLRGRSFAAVDINSFGGWVMAQKELKDANIEGKDFAELEFLGSHDSVVMAIANGSIDAGSVRTDTYERMIEEGLIDAHSCRAIMPKKYKDFPYVVTTTLYPEWPFAKLSSTSESLTDRVLIALLEMPANSKAAFSANIAGWTIPLDYSKVLNLLEELHLGPFKRTPEISIWSIYEKYALWVNFILLLFGVITLALIFILFLNKKLTAKREEIGLLNSGLEQKIQERTKSLKKMYTHEKYLKNILTTITDINELLMSSFSIESILKNSMERLIEHRNYQLAIISFNSQNLPTIIAQSTPSAIGIEYNLYDEDRENFFFVDMKKVVDENSGITKKIPKETRIKIGESSYECSDSYMLILPLGKSEEGSVLGALALFSKRESGYEPQEINILENLAIDIGLSLVNIKQKSILKEMALEKISNYEETILAFVNIIEQRDSYTAGHTLRVAKYCRLIAEELGIEEEEIVVLEKAAVLHDIGKVVTPDSILLKPSRLNPLEYELIKQHVEAGYKMLCKIDMYKDLAEIIRYHHIRYDGKGYPPTSHSNPNEVPLLSYIMSIADAFDAMTSNRIYKKKKSVAEAIEELQELSATQFHPDIVPAAIEALKGVVVENTSQLPSSELEERRFSYFFLDSLTDLYNESYLNLILLGNEKRYKSLNIVKLTHFSEFNKRAGWSSGNIFLKEFASALREKFKDSAIFRYQGDDFVLLFLEERVILHSEIDSFSLLKNSSVTATLSYFDLERESVSL